MLPLVISVEDTVQGSKRQFAFADSPVRLGRSPFAELQLTEDFVSRWEGTLRFDDKDVTYFNLSSTNPTFVSGRQVAANEEVVIGPDSIITIGNLNIRFSRVPVSDSEVRRRGKRAPTPNTDIAELKTRWLGALQPGDALPKKLEAPSVNPVVRSEPKPAVAARIPDRPKVSSQEDKTSSPSASEAATPPVGLDGHYAAYRQAWELMLREICRALDGVPVEERAKWADQLQRDFPQITQEPAFRAELKRLGLEARKPDIPQIGEWLEHVAEGLLPRKFRLDTGLTLERVLSLLELLSQSIAEINDAQESVRKRWLGRAPRPSVLNSDNGRVILAYLLNPKADWSERSGEIEESLRNVVMHEVALFKATLEGARTLLEVLSPRAIAEAAKIDLSQLEDEADSPKLWQRLTAARGDVRAELWRRFVSTYESLQDGARYQRVFMGRGFARTYLAAMGQAGGDAESTQPPSE